MKFSEKRIVFFIIDQGDGISLNSKAQLNNDISEPQERQRGFQTILEMGFIIGFSGNEVNVNFDFK